MTALVWDQVGSRNYEYGIENAVLYLESGLAVPWNGLTSIEEDNSDRKLQTYYIDGRPVLNRVPPGAFKGTLSAITYPDEFLAVEGTLPIFTDTGPGLYAANQESQTFNLVYKTKKGNDVASDAGYKLHLVYDLTASPANVGYETTSLGLSPIEFSWDIASAVPALGYGSIYPTAHYIVDSTETNWWYLEFLQEQLFGTSGTDPIFPTQSQFIYDFLVVNAQVPSIAITVTDNGDGSFTITDTAGQISMIDANTFQITGIDASYQDANTWTVSTTYS